ncbi:MAG: ATP-binding protein [Methylacidiphilales bacterium]|nr:ATP-binding protein [Candidatus Methylacidiphilales bacterium]
MNPPATQDVTVLDLPFFDAQVSDVTLGSEVARLLEQNHSLPGVIVMNKKRFRGMVSRNQFFQRLGRPFGIEIYSSRAITAFLDSLPAPPLVVPAETTIQNAAIICLARPAENVYDPFVVSGKDLPPRLVDFLALIVKQTELLTAAQIEAHAQRAAAISASNAKSDFLANMSHELRTPLTAIIGYSEILIEDVKAGQIDGAVPRLESIAKSGLHLLEMINGILDLAKIEARKMDLFLTTFSLPDFILEITALALPLMKKNDNEFKVTSDHAVVEMHSDEAKLRQSLTNLLGNAAKFTSRGRVTLDVQKETRADGDWVVFQVSDTGIGMSEEQMGRLFESFYQADSSISRRYGGTGLGLSLSKQFCEMLGGNLTAKSALDQGTTFTMKVPVRSKEPAGNASDLR